MLTYVWRHTAHTWALAAITKLKYRVTTYKTITGTREYVDLGDHAYGEWIVYDGIIPKYHINCFRESSDSDTRIKFLLDKQKRTIGDIIIQVNSLTNQNLSIGERPLLEHLIASNIKELELKPLPIEWLE